MDPFDTEFRRQWAGCALTFSCEADLIYYLIRLDPFQQI